MEKPVSDDIWHQVFNENAAGTVLHLTPHTLSLSQQSVTTEYLFRPQQNTQDWNLIP